MIKGWINLTLKEAERKLWADAYYDTKIKYIDLDSVGILKDYQEFADDTDYYTKSQIDTILNDILAIQDANRKKEAKTFIEDNIELLEESVDNFLDKCPGTIMDGVCAILKDAGIITDEDLEKCVQRIALKQLNYINSTITAKSQYQYMPWPLINPVWEESITDIGTFDD